MKSLLALAALLVPWRRVVVFLAKPQSEMTLLDVAAGPVARAEGGTGLLASPWLQEDGVGPTQLEHLFRILVPGRGGTPWVSSRRAGRARLYETSDAFVDRLMSFHAEVGELEAAEPPVKGRARNTKRSERVLAPYTRVAEVWLDRATWPRGMEVSGLATVLVSLAGAAETARAIHEPLYVWYGPVTPRIRVTVQKDSDGTRVVETK